jgi:hypothetical protein
MKLTPRQLAQIDRVIHPRDTPLAVRCAGNYVDSWQACATAADVFVTDWIESALRAAVQQKDLPKYPRYKRDRSISYLFSRKDILAWKDAAELAGDSLTGWVERALNFNAKVATTAAALAATYAATTAAAATAATSAATRDATVDATTAATALRGKRWR